MTALLPVMTMPEDSNFVAGLANGLLHQHKILDTGLDHPGQRACY
jgi:hypothetical protein